MDTMAPSFLIRSSAVNQDSHKILVDFVSDWTIRFGVTCLWASKMFPIDF